MARSTYKSQYEFSKISAPRLPRSVFNRSRRHITTFDPGLLIPVFVDEVLPGDTISFSYHNFSRLITPLHPLMDNARIRVEAFWCPNRLVSTNWVKLNGEQTDPGDSTDYLSPIINAPDGSGGDPTGYPSRSIYDYLGLPVNVSGIWNTAYVLRMYNLTYNQWYRDQDLQDSLPVPLDDGPDPWDTYELKRRAKHHDYFTSARPWPQKGPDVTLSLTGNAPVVSTGDPINFDYSGLVDQPGVYRESSGYGFINIGNSGTVDDPVSFGSSSGLEADLTAVTAFAINALREAAAVQQMFELDARGGTRYIEILQSHFGTSPRDDTLQNVEYLGGASSPLNFVPVPQTSSTDTTSPQGNLSAYAVSSSSGDFSFTKSFTEHGHIMVLASVQADLTYQQGINAMWSRRERFDYFWPILNHIGEQPILNKEIFAQGTSADDEAWGYQEAWAPYKYSPSLVTGGMRSNVTDSFDVWHLAQDFDALPVLGPDFIEEDAPFERVVATPDIDMFLYDAYFKVKHTRCMSVYSTPGLRRF